MISRRDVLIGTAGAAAAAIVGRTAPVSAKAAQPKTPVSFAVPPGACDCHTHIIGDAARYPFTPSRVYSPEGASVDESLAMHRALRVDRIIIVQPSVYGTDNRCALDAVRQLGAKVRGVAVIDDKTPETALDELNTAGFRGIRINLETSGQTDPAVGRERFQAAVARVRARRWHVQVYTRLSVIEGIKDLVAASPVPVVFDHFGLAQASQGAEQPGFATLAELLRSGKAYVKISAPYFISQKTPDYPDAAPIARALVAANPERVLWASNWPHTDSRQVPGRKPTDPAPHFQMDDGLLLNQLAVWVPDAGVRKTILVDNPVRLYGF